MKITNKRKIEILNMMIKLNHKYLCIGINILLNSGKISSSEFMLFSGWFSEQRPKYNSKWSKNKYFKIEGIAWWDVTQATIDGNYEDLMKEKIKFLKSLIKSLTIL